MNLPIIKYGSPILRKKAFDIDKRDDFREIIANMYLSLKKEAGIGLAGPQVGILKNIFIIDLTPLKKDGIEPVEKMYVNPEIINYSKETDYQKEGCLSIPGINEDVLRPRKIEVRYRDENFDWHEEIFEGLIARIFQHEYDHLHGILFIDRISQIQKKLIRGKLQKIRNCK